MFKTNKTNPIITHTSIVEWDMRSANTSILREFGLAPDKVIDKLDSLDKELREKRVGQMQAKKKGLAKEMEDGFNLIINKFIEMNGLEEDDVISIKRDAVFVRAKNPKITTIGQYCVFRPKSTYIAFLLLNGLEFYMKQDKSFDIKGIDDKMIPLHENGILEFIRGFLEDFDYDMEGLHRYCKDFVSAYKNRELPLEYYREFNGESVYSVILPEGSFKLDNISEDILDQVNIKYNYENIVLPLIQYLF